MVYSFKLNGWCYSWTQIKPHALTISVVCFVELDVHSWTVAAPKELVDRCKEHADTHKAIDHNVVSDPPSVLLLIERIVIMTK